MVKNNSQLSRAWCIRIHHSRNGTSGTTIPSLFSIDRDILSLIMYDIKKRKTAQYPFIKKGTMKRRRSVLISEFSLINIHLTSLFDSDAFKTVLVQLYDVATCRHYETRSSVIALNFVNNSFPRVYHPICLKHSLFDFNIC